ncbi:F-box protein pp2-b15 [Phtheirospermum japonicum]|uniref:F-box protein pp2-b15 n=1 Tax=Phtheirospermum japonicum TaxID=374723 RepID=A0A830CJP8_9LAMI|nr:F-box protein pp2-b15 [Phtheirospermum japonicum]
MEALPEECLSHIVSLTSPGDACRAAAVSASLRDAADSDLAWENLLPSDYHEIVSRSVSPLEFSSNKDLFRRLSTTPLLVDGGKMTFSIDKSTNKKCCMLSARELAIAWSSDSLCWSWKPLLGSRFPEVIELIMVCWLEIRGKLNTRMLSPNTTYCAFIIIQLRDRAFGLDKAPFEVSVEVGDYKTQKTLYLELDGHKDFKARSEKEDEVVRGRVDTWLEVELGEFYNNGNDQNKEVKMWFGEIKGVHLKGGLVIQGIELRPKH